MIRIALDADLERRFKEACDNHCVKQAQLLRKLVEPVIAGWIRSGSLPDLPQNSVSDLPQLNGKFRPEPVMPETTHDVLEPLSLNYVRARTPTEQLAIIDDDLPLTDEAKNYLIDEHPDAFVDDDEEEPDDDAGDDNSWG